MQKAFEHVVIVGCGLLGTSLGMALRRRLLARRITGVGRTGSPSVQVAKQRGAIDAATDDLALAVGGGGIERATIPPADLVVMCVPVRQFPALFQAMGSRLAPGALVTDVGSTKTQVMRWAAESLPAAIDFVGSHPMAGSEKTGPEAARDDLYNGAICLICPPEVARPSTAAAVDRITMLWQALGMRVVPCGAAQHDRWVASVSHLPHALAFALMNAAGQDPAALQAAAGGFADMTRIASSDAAMWTDIFLTNREAVLAALDAFNMELAALKSAVEKRDEAAIRKCVLAARDTREAFMQRRNAKNASSAAQGEK